MTPAAFLRRVEARAVVFRVIASVTLLAVLLPDIDTPAGTRRTMS